MLYWAVEQNEEKSPQLTQFTTHFNNVSQWSVPIPCLHVSIPVCILAGHFAKLIMALARGDETILGKFSRGYFSCFCSVN